MQMVNCDKCGKPIDHAHYYGLTTKGAVHISCDDPFGHNMSNDGCRKTKTLPSFTWELKDRNKTV